MSKPKQIPWEAAGWLKEASDWIEAELGRRAISLTGPIEQPHTYPWSIVLRVPASDGILYFKATAPLPSHEVALTRALAAWRPDCMPELLAVDLKRGWMLMRDAGRMLRDLIRPTRDLEPWVAVLSLYAGLQLEMSGRVSQLLALGVPDRRLAALPGLYTGLLADAEILRIDQPAGLTSAEYGRLQELGPRFAGICAQLASYGIPESLNHGDFHDGNVLLRDGEIVFFDWGDCSVTHPFISLRTVFVSVENSLQLEDYAFTPEMIRLRDLYLQSWSGFAPPDKLLEAFTLSRCLAPVVGALAWHPTVASVEGSAREKYQHILPSLLQEFLVYEGGLPD
jgi:hypothetical protein